MNSRLGKRIARQIEMSGPMPLAEFMNVCLSDPLDGYYASKNPFGRRGDFITAPEISQMFGEIIGIWILSVWQQMGEPSPFNLVEYGPGRGTLTVDIMRTVAISPQFMQAVRVNLVETSEKLAEEQQNHLAGNKAEIIWRTNLDELSDMPMILIANEFLDAIPFHQYVKAENQWHQRAVGLDEAGNLSWVLCTETLVPALLPKDAGEEQPGSVFEISPAREAMIEELARRLVKSHGAALFIDYGHANSGFGDTFQAVKSHDYSNPLDQPGFNDLTGHIDFEALGRAAVRGGAIVKPLMNQGEFLQKLGLLERAGSLGANQGEAIQQKLKLEAERLALPQHMGELFKVFAICGRALDMPPFEP